MATVVSYARPSTLAEALDLLARPDAVALAGGTTLNAAPTPEPVAVVDLQALGLDRIEERGDWTLRIGATSTLQQLADTSCAPAAVREAARRELPSTLRARATVGGCIATAHPASELLAALLVHEAHVEIAGELVPLDSFLEHPPRGLITAVSLRSAGVSMVARTGRTRADRPIVAAAARRKPDGACLLALSGVASRPLLVHDLESLDPPGDFRGSRDYRRALASVLARRVLEAVE